MEKQKFSLLIILLFFFTGISFAQQNIAVSGTVRSAEDSEVLIGVSVTVKGTRAGTVTNIEGKYTINAPQGSTLVFSYVGMNAMEMKVDRAVIDATMSSGMDLEEIVVIGYGGAKKTDLTGSVSTINTKDLMVNNPVSVNQGLQGKMAGVFVTQSDGAPGAGVNILIRGANSFSTSSEPLYIVDGIPFDAPSTPTSSATEGTSQAYNPLSLINPNDIENITILKDASATAIYGSRGANGVVLITTRKGKEGNDRIEFNMNLGISQAIKKMDVLSGYDYANYMNESVRNYVKYDGATANIPYPADGRWDNTNKIFTPSPEDFLLGYLNGGPNWQDEIFQNAFTQEYNLSYSGADKKGHYAISGNYTDQTGVIKNSGYERLNLRLNLARKVHSWIEIGTNTSVTRSISNFTKTNAMDDNGIIRAALWFPPDRSAYDNQTGEATRLKWFAANPSTYTDNVTDELTSYNIFSSNFMELTFTKDLHFKQNIGLSYTGNARNNYYTRDTREGMKDQDSPDGGLAGQSDNWNTGFTSESILTFNKTFNKIHQLNAMGAFTAERGDYGSKNITVFEFDNDFTKMYSLQGGKQIRTPYSGRGMSSLVSYLGRVNYTLKDRYMITASFRYDGSSKFQEDNRWAFFPSGALAWRASEESFIKSLSVFSNLKLRASYGETGNQGIGPYMTVPSLSTANAALNGSKVGGGVDSYLPNINLVWESTKQLDAGIDMGFFENKLNLTVDVYKKYTYNLLQNMLIPPSTGFSSKMMNSGDVTNRGLEITMQAYLLNSTAFKWDINANIAFNRNEINGLKGDQFAQRLWHNADQVFIQRNGQPIGVIYGYKEDGFYDNEAEVRADPVYKNASNAVVLSKIGEVKYKDMDGKEGITGDDRTIIGDVNPDFTYGFINNFQWKGITMSLFFQGVQGSDILNANKMSQTMSGIGNITQDAYDKRWTPENYENAKYPKPYSGYGRAMKISDRYVEDGSYFRLRNLSLGYNFKSPFREIESVSLFLNATNLFTITNYSWFDPDVNAFGGDASRRGVDMFSYPSSRSYSLGFKLIF